jgi:hypothetical protein
MKIFRKYTLNENFFDNLNEKSCYWLGFLYADGYVRQRKSSELRLKLKEDDKPHIEKFIKDLDSNSPIKYYSDGKSNCCYVSINSNKLVSKLFELGCVQNKTQEIRLPSNMPNKLINHFIRGYFDGDGSIYKLKSRSNSYKISICSNNNFIDDIYNFFNFGSIVKYENYGLWIINKIDYIKYFRDFIYKDKETFLERKFIIFESIDDNYKRDYSQTKRDRKKYIITDPDGKIFVIENLNKFCKENRLIYSTMSNLSRGIGNSNKGWKCEFKK